MEVINFIYMKNKGKNKEPRKFLFFRKVGMQVTISLFLASFRVKLSENKSQYKRTLIESLYLKSII